MPLLRVTSFTLVWIKIPPTACRMMASKVTSFTLVWIKINMTRAEKTKVPRHELHARVD